MPDAAIFNDAICHPVTKYGCAERNRTLEGRERKQNEAANPMFFGIGLPSCFVLPCFATGCHTFGLKIATAAMRPRNDTNWSVLVWKTDVFHFGGYFCAVSPHKNLKLFVLETASFSSKTYQICHCEEGAFFAPDAAI